MSTADNNLPLLMTHADLKRVPRFALASGFTLQWYQPGDESHWLRIHLAADRFSQITPDLFTKQFGSPPSNDLHRRQCYVREPGGECVGTATAWFNDDFQGARWGRVHWVAIIPAFQGRGLGKALMSAICRRLRDLGHGRAYLRTGAARVPAIKLYQRFGFEPLIGDEREREAWRAVLSKCRDAS